MAYGNMERMWTLEEYIKKYEQLQAELDKHKEVLGDLVDIQNSPPLIRDTENWNKIMEEAYKLLGRE